jgi:hypothetical protein
MAKIIPFEEAMKAANKNCSLMIANGFSIKYFKYANLLEKAGLDGGSPLRRLFDALSTVDFEIVIRALEDAALVERTYNKEKRARSLSSEADKLRRTLVHAVRVTHPGHREDIADEIPACIGFLSQFDTIFTLNYDLLLYWVILEDTKRFQDGFGLAEDRNGFRWPRLPAPYGALHGFRARSKVRVIEPTDADRKIVSALSDYDVHSLNKRFNALAKKPRSLIHDRVHLSVISASHERIRCTRRDLFASRPRYCPCFGERCAWPSCRARNKRPEYRGIWCGAIRGQIERPISGVLRSPDGGYLRKRRTTHRAECARVRPPKRDAPVPSTSIRGVRCPDRSVFLHAPPPSTVVPLTRLQRVLPTANSESCSVEPTGTPPRLFQGRFQAEMAASAP